MAAWKEVRENKGSAGIDGVTFEMIEEYGVESYLLGIPVIRDRIIQQACGIVVEPIFEANFVKCSYGFRSKRDAIQASTIYYLVCSKEESVTDVL